MRTTSLRNCSYSLASLSGLLLAACLSFLAPGARGFPVITNVVEVGGDNEVTDTVTAKWTGVTFVGGVANEPVNGLSAGASFTVPVFGIGTPAPSYVDRNHMWTNAAAGISLPSYLVGAEYIMNGNDNRDNATMTMTVFVTRPVRCYLIIDNRLGDTSNANPPTFGATSMQWVISEGWQPVRTGSNRTSDPSLPDEIGIDEGADGTINNNSSIYYKDFPAGGSFVLKQADNAGQNMYGAAVTALPGSLPNVVNIGQNKIGTVTDNGNGSYTIVGGGNDIWAQRDEFTYAYTEVTGDFDVQVRVESVQANARWTKAGIMVRESLTEYSRMAFARATPPDVPTGNGGNGANDIRFAYRTGLDNVAGLNGGEHEDPGAGFPSPTNNPWIRLIRTNTTFTMLSSSNGTDWAFIASQNTTNWGGGAISNQLFVGLGVSRHSAGLTATGQFSGFRFNTNAAPLTLVNASSRGNPTGIRVSFNNPVGSNALVAANYALTTLTGPSNLTVIKALRFTTANDSPPRDPVLGVLEGTTADPAIGAWKRIAAFDTGLTPISARNTVGPVVPIANTASYRAYRLLFTTVRDAAAANSMQIAEIEFLDASTNRITMTTDSVLGVQGRPGDPVSLVASVGTVGNANNYPAAEHPGLVIDTSGGTKYLNFAKTNVGVIVSPTQGGVVQANPTVLSVAPGPNAFSVQLTVSGLIEEASYLLGMTNVQGADGTLVTTNITIVHGFGYEARRIHVTHDKTDDFGYWMISDAVAKGLGDVTALGGGVFPGVQSNIELEDPLPDTGSNERFSGRAAGVLVPRASGNHTFYMSSDDNGRLYQSTDESPANKVQIASEPAWNGRREYIAGGNQVTRGTPPSNISAPIALQAGGKYYTEVIYTEGGGGNNGSATWLPPGGVAVANGSPPINETNFIPSRLVNGSVFFSLGPVQLLSQPTNLVATALTPATFRVRIDGTPNYNIQWRRNGVNIPGANSATYTIPAAPLTDDQAVFSVVVANEFSSVVSSNAVLSVLAPTPPHLTAAAADATFTTVRVTFDNRLDVATGTNITNYVISGGVTVLSATRDSSGRAIILRTSPMAEDTTYTLTVFSIRDETGTQVLTPNPSAINFSSLTFAQGFILKEYYQQFTAGAGSVDAFITAQRAGNTPITQSCLTNIYEFNVADQYDNYGGRMVGFFVPPVTGNYIFYFASDDFGRLFLSTDSNPANVREIAREPVWANRREWTGPGGGGGRGTATNVSAAINLTAGQRYYIESYFTEGGGGDNMGVAVQGPGDAIPVNGGPGIPGTMLGTYVLAGNLAITAQPRSQTNVNNGFVAFNVTASGASSLCGGGTINYQWRSNGVPVAGATGPSLIVGPLHPSANGAAFSVSVTSPGRNLISSNAVLTVNADTNGPKLLSVRADSSFRTLRLNWNELLSSGPVTDSSNYRITDPLGNELFILDPIEFINGSNVVLHLQTPMATNTVYTVEISAQQDIAGNLTAKVGNPTVDPDHGIVTTVRSFYLRAGLARFDAYLGLTVPANNDLTPLLTSSGYTNENPSFAFYTNVVNWPQSVPDINNYGMRWRFFFTAPTTGTYKFEMAHDDGGNIYAATNGNPGSAVLVMHEDCCNGFLATEPGWTNDLAAGQIVYFEVDVIEAGGGDYAGLSVTLPGGQYIAPITSQYISALADPLDPQLAGFTAGRAAGGQIVITWGAGFCLQEATTLGPAAVWTPSTVVNGVPFTPPATGNKFYRLVNCQ